MVKHIQSPRAIYGMQQKGIDGAEEPSERIEDMARIPSTPSSGYNLTGRISWSGTRSVGWSRWKWRGN